MITLGHYNKLSLSSLWKHEAKDFTPWLYDNLELLSEAVGFAISKPITEFPTDNFFIDIVAVTGEKDDKIVVIENQYGNSNHDHLGKLLSYAAAKEARYAIWIVESARIEHIQAIEMLNRATDLKCSFFLIEAEVFKVDDSNPVIVFNKVAEPETIESDDKSIPSVAIMYEWWQMFVKLAKEKNVNLFANLKPLKQHFMSCRSGRYGVFYEIAVSKTSTTLKLGLSKSGDKDWGNRCYDILFPHRIEVEDLFGSTLDWNRMTENNLSKISKTYEGGYDIKDWQPFMEFILSELVKLKKAFKPFLNEL